MPDLEVSSAPRRVTKQNLKAPKATQVPYARHYKSAEANENKKQNLTAMRNILGRAPEEEMALYGGDTESMLCDTEKTLGAKPALI